MVVPMSDTVRHYKTHKHFGACDFLICVLPKICFIKEKKLGGYAADYAIVSKTRMFQNPRAQFQDTKEKPGMSGKVNMAGSDSCS